MKEICFDLPVRSLDDVIRRVRVHHVLTLLPHQPMPICSFQHSAVNALRRKLKRRKTKSFNFPSFHPAGTTCTFASVARKHFASQKKSTIRAKTRKKRESERRAIHQRHPRITNSSSCRYSTASLHPCLHGTEDISTVF